MVMLVTLEQAKQHLRIQDLDSDGHPDDPDLTLKVKAASRAALNYCGLYANFLDSNGDVPIDSNGDAVVPDDVRAATLLLVGDLYREREGVNASEWEHGFLPRTVVSLLYPYRLPTLA